MEEEMKPPGFRLCPTDEELINGYLKPLIKGQLQDRWKGMITEKQLYGEDAAPPWHMFQDENEWQQPRTAIKNNVYAFTKLIKHKSRVARTAGCGVWHAETRKTEIMTSNGGGSIGEKKMLTFQIKNNYPNTTDIDNLGHWIMHEYSIPDMESEYVLCEIIRDYSKRIKKCTAAVDKALLQIESTSTNRKRTLAEKADQDFSKRRKHVVTETSSRIETNDEKFQNLNLDPLPIEQFKDSTTGVSYAAAQDYISDFDEILNFEIPENWHELVENWHELVY